MFEIKPRGLVIFVALCTEYNRVGILQSGLVIHVFFSDGARVVCVLSRAPHRVPYGARKIQTRLLTLFLPR